MNTRDRLNELLLSADPAQAVRDALAEGWLDAAIPELRAEMDFPQLTHWHHLTNLEHSLATMAAMPANIDERLAGLFHDIGKRRTTTIKMINGEEQYLGHAPVGARLTHNILAGLGYEPERIERICRWIAHHMDLHAVANNGHSAKAQAKLLAKIEPDLAVLERLQLADTGAMNPKIASVKLAEARAYHAMLAETIAQRAR